MNTRTIFACLALLPLAIACGGSTGGEGGATHSGGATSTTTNTTTTGSKVDDTCVTDAICVFRESGCCGACGTATQALPPPLQCGQDCQAPPQCACVGGACTAGTLAVGDACATDHDLCGPGATCCNTCCGPDGGAPGDPMPKCTNALGGVCPAF